MKRSREEADASVAGASHEQDDDLCALLKAVRPSVAIFDLDSTLWNGNCEAFTEAHITGADEAVNAATGNTLRLFPDVKRIFSVLIEHDVPIGIASASPATATATRLMRSFGLAYGHAHIAPGRKDVHLKGIASKLSVDLKKAIFFDDLPHNLKTAQSLGVSCVHVKGGIRIEDVRKGLKVLKERGKQQGAMRAFLQPKS